MENLTKYVANSNKEENWINLVLCSAGLDWSGGQSHSAGARTLTGLAGNITDNYLICPGAELVRTAPPFSWITTSPPASDWTPTRRTGGTSSPRPSPTPPTSRRSV